MSGIKVASGELVKNKGGPAGVSCSGVAPGYVDLSSLEHDLIELVGCKFHQIDEIDSGKWPGQYDITKWIDKYQGKQNLPPHVVELNNFRNEVDQFVSLIMSVIQKHT
jgi:hypothetical protein